MSFLYMQDGQVLPTEEGKLLPQVKSVYNADKTDGKQFYKDVLMYVFMVYNKEGVYKDSFEGYRKTMVVERHLPKRNAQDLESNKRVKDLIAEYLERQMNKNERLLYRLEQDMENLLDHISSIPYTKSVTLKIPYTGEDGETTYVPTKVEVSNAEEKAKSIKLAEGMVDYGDKLKQKILRDKTDNKKKGAPVRLFDRAKK